MKKQLIIFVFLFSIFSCKLEPKVDANEKKLATEERQNKQHPEVDDWEITPLISVEDFLLEFKKAVEGHNTLQVYNYLDDYYIEEQLHFLEGDKEQLVNDLFCGISEEDGFLCFDLMNIQEINILRIEEMNFSQSVFFEVVSLHSKITLELYIQELVNDEGYIVYSLMGAMG